MSSNTKLVTKLGVAFSVPPVNEVVRVLEALSKGDLTERNTVHYTGTSNGRLFSATTF